MTIELQSLQDQQRKAACKRTRSKTVANMALTKSDIFPLFLVMACFITHPRLSFARIRPFSSLRQSPLYSSPLTPSFSPKSRAFQRVPFFFSLRGGGAASATTLPPGSTVSEDAFQRKSYHVQQQLHLQSRSLQLRQELIARGLDTLRHGGAGDSDAARAKPVDWDCALSTADHPKSCLYSFDAEEGAKVIAPIDTTQWITLTSLNRLRRSDPTKIEPLWHSQYAILSSWFAPESQYSLYSHLSPLGTALSLLLDAPWLLGMLIAAALGLTLLLTLPAWEVVLTTLLTSKFLWIQWPNWARFVHAAFPLKLLFGQMAWKALAVAFQRLYNEIRTLLVELECKLWQESIPLTVVEDEFDVLDEQLSVTLNMNREVDEYE